MKNSILIMFLLATLACKKSEPKDQSVNPIEKETQLQGNHQKAAKLLIEARNQNKLITLPKEWEPTTLEEGYQIQDEIIQRIGTPQIGWKVAITNKALMDKAGVTEPVSGPLFEQWLHQAPYVEEKGTPTLYGIEFEFAFKMNSDLPKKDTPYTLEEVKEAVESMHIAIEPVGTRYEMGPVQSGVNLFAADHGGNFSFIHSDAIENWRELDLAEQEVVGYFENKEVGREKGSNVHGNPLNSLTWLANHLIKRGHHIKAGDWITTGAVIGPIPVQPPMKIKGDFGALGSIEFDFKK